MNPLLNRRDFLRQSFAFSALAAGLVPRSVYALAPDRHAKHILMVGDWGKQENTIGQGQVASAMVNYANTNGLHTEALFLLGDSWYGPLPGGPDDPRWKRQFEDMYPATAFPGPAYSIMGNHDYQRMPPMSPSARPSSPTPAAATPAGRSPPSGTPSTYPPRSRS